MERKRVWNPLAVSVVMALSLLFAALPFQTAKADAKAFAYIIDDADSRYLTYDDIADMPIQVVCYAKNELYARHGRSFVSRELTGYFEGQPWYYGFISPESFDSSVFNQYETANIQLLSDREKALNPSGYILDRAGYSYDAIYEYVYGETLVEVEITDYLFEDSDIRYLTADEVQDLSAQALCYAKNEIYARHGRMFLSQELQDFFNSKDWYWGTVRPENFSDAVFNSYETANVQLLSDYEKAKAPGGYALDQPGYDIYQVYGGFSSEFITDREYIFYDSDTRYLAASEVNSLSAKMACYAKNEIYARRGRLFNSPELSNYFSGKSWYYGRISPESFSTDVFNKYELENIRMLKEREYSLNPNGYPLDQ